MKLQTFNYHTHTYLCGHAIGTAEEMIQAAISAGFKTIGISEHMGYEGWDDPKERIPYKEIDDYIAMINALKEKYKDQIQVCVGFECEYFKDCLEHLKHYQSKCDYLICGQHAYDRKEHYYDKEPYDEDEYIEIMAEQVCEAIEYGLFKYIAHPDYFMMGKKEYTPRKEAAIRKIARCAKVHDVVMEINLKGCKYGKKEYSYGLSYHYPNTRTYEILAEEGVKVCFGYDAHHPNYLLHREKEVELREAFAHLQLNFVEDLVF